MPDEKGRKPSLASLFAKAPTQTWRLCRQDLIVLDVDGETGQL
jgi:hypothetical protein